MWARLGRKEQVWQALSRITDRYVNPRLFSLHPATQRQAAKGGMDCITCFREKGGSLDDRREPADNKRGFAHQDKSVFQFDGNMGYVAAVAEALMQSHVPGEWQGSVGSVALFYLRLPVTPCHPLSLLVTSLSHPCHTLVTRFRSLSTPVTPCHSLSLILYQHFHTNHPNTIISNPTNSDPYCSNPSPTVTTITHSSLL